MLGKLFQCKQQAQYNASVTATIFLARSIVRRLGNAMGISGRQWRVNKYLIDITGENAYWRTVSKQCCLCSDWCWSNMVASVNRWQLMSYGRNLTSKLAGVINIGVLHFCLCNSGSRVDMAMNMTPAG